MLRVFVAGFSETADSLLHTRECDRMDPRATDQCRWRYARPENRIDGLLTAEKKANKQYTLVPSRDASEGKKGAGFSFLRRAESEVAPNSA